jgi:hypothetical protein
VLTSLDVSFGFSAPGMLEHTIQLILSGMSLHAAAIFRAGTAFLELTAGTQFRRSLIFMVVSPFVIMPSVEGMSRRTGEGVGVWLIGEGLFGEDPFLST